GLARALLAWMAAPGSGRRLAVRRVFERGMALAHRAAGRTPLPPPPQAVFDPAARERFLSAVGRSWPRPPLPPLTDELAPYRLLNLWLDGPGLRDRFPGALGEGGLGAFARWLTTPQAGLHPQAAPPVLAA